MNAEQTTTMFAYFSRAWPAAQIGDDTPAVWVDAFTGVDIDHARVAAKAVVAKCKFFPSVAEVLEEVAAAKRAAEAPTRAIDSAPVCDPETNARWLAACREVLDARRQAWTDVGMSPPPLRAADERARRDLA